MNSSEHVTIPKPPLRGQVSELPTGWRCPAFSVSESSREPPVGQLRKSALGAGLPTSPIEGPSVSSLRLIRHQRRTARAAGRLDAEAKTRTALGPPPAAALKRKLGELVTRVALAEPRLPYATIKRPVGAKSRALVVRYTSDAAFRSLPQPSPRQPVPRASPRY